MDEANIIKKLIIQRLIRGDIWGGKHTPLDFTIKGLPQHYRMTHQGKKEIEEALKDLVNSGWIIITFKRTGKGSDQHISLNPQISAEIKRFLEENN